MYRMVKHDMRKRISYYAKNNSFRYIVIHIAFDLKKKKKTFNHGILVLLIKKCKINKIHEKIIQ